jgi:mannosyl-3-phosphoglycerate phosphatase family protein
MNSSPMNSSDKIYWMIVTDLDGTLLDHHDYSFQAAKNTLSALEKHKIPVIFNSSKTATEIHQIRNTLNNTHPFIAENGSGILIPKNYFSSQPEEANTWKNFWEVNLGKPRQELLNSLEKIPSSFQDLYRSFSDSNVTEIMDMTGLSKSEAKLSMDRLYTEPLLWLGSKEQKEQFFWHLNRNRIHFTEGGRFIHLMGYTNKGSATTWLTELYKREYQRNVKVIALGDGKNDIDMLKAADIAVVIRSPVNTTPEFEHPCKIISDQPGPAGWAQTIEHIFEFE